MPAPLRGSPTGTHKGKNFGWMRGGEETFLAPAVWPVGLVVCWFVLGFLFAWLSCFASARGFFGSLIFLCEL